MAGTLQIGGKAGPLGKFALATAAFHAAYLWPFLAPAMLVFAWMLLELTCGRPPRSAFRAGVLLGLCVYTPHLLFLWNLFDWIAVPLWFVLPGWLGVFCALAAVVQASAKPWISLPLIPLLWMGIEYFRSELYPLGFSWLTPGFAFSGSHWPMHWTGLYGVGFILFLLAQLLACAGRWKYYAAPLALALVLIVGNLGKLPDATHGSSVAVAGLQIEFPAELELPPLLDRVVSEHPETKIVVLSEYAIDGTPSAKLLAWAAQRQCYLIIGGKESLPGGGFFNTAFVISPQGTIVFKQAKKTPVQFMDDGLPAVEQQVWHSPWGRIGLCICYDLSYARVVDPLIQQGAQALIVPTMDVIDWGGWQHYLHSLVGPARAAECGLPMLRLASSGVSQLIDERGRVRASAGFPDQGRVVAGRLDLMPQASLPLDRYLIPVALLAASLVAVYGCAGKWRTRASRPPSAAVHAVHACPREAEPLECPNAAR